MEKTKKNLCHRSSTSNFHSKVIFSMEIFSAVEYCSICSSAIWSFTISLSKSHTENLLRIWHTRAMEKFPWFWNGNILFKLTFLCRVYSWQSTALWWSITFKKKKLARETKKTQNSLVFFNNKYFCIYLDTLEQIWSHCNKLQRSRQNRNYETRLFLLYVFIVTNNKLSFV